VGRHGGNLPGSWEGNHVAGPDEPISALIRRARLALGLSPDGLARQLAEVSSGPCATRELVARWERGTHIPGPYWRGPLSRVLDQPAGALERAATVARLRRIFVAEIGPAVPEVVPAGPAPAGAPLPQRGVAS
jgi:hypothetical protein